MQHKREAYWFYRYLSRFYDRLVNPLFWTEGMRERALAIGKWAGGEALTVVDVGAGTGFTTLGIASRVPARNITCVDQSHHQMERAMERPELADCRFRIGDAERIPFPDDTFDRYVSAGSIEYWPDPQRGVCEAYRVTREGGYALLIGPIQPANPVSRFIADTWMLFPPENDYFLYFQEAGFVDLEWTYVRPHWQANERYGIALLGRKPAPGPSPAAAAYAPVASERALTAADPPGAWLGQNALLASRLLVGSLAGFLFIPLALVAHVTAPLRGVDPGEDYQPLNREQRTVLTVLGTALAFYAGYKLTRRRR